MTQLNNLRNKIQFFKDASMFEKQAAGESVLRTALAILEDYENRLAALEGRNGT